MLDTYRAVETPEGVELGLRVAGLPARMLAYGIDSVIRILMHALSLAVLAPLGTIGGGIFLLSLFVGAWFYPVLFEVLWGGATPGKRALGLVVLHDDGTPVGWTASIVRNLLRTADLLPFAYGLGILSMLFSRDFKRLGDHAARTVVVYREREAASLPLAGARSWAPPVPLAAAEQKAIIDFSHRLPKWSDERACELSDLASPLTGARGEEGLTRLVGAANWLVGRR